MQHDSVDILTRYEQVQPYLASVRKVADANTEALGFYPADVYAHMAQSEKLFVAASGTDEARQYVGHLLFDCRFPRAHVLQMFCTEAWRRRGVSTQLLDALIEHLTAQGFMSVQARVAEDLRAANEFWASRGFYAQRSEQGRGANRRQIAVRIRELESPQLFPKSGLAQSAGNPLGLFPAVTSAQPLYLVDLNVLFDLAEHRVRHEMARALFSAANAGFCRIAVSEEVRAELTRTKRAVGVDPMLEFIATLPHLARPTGSDADLLYGQLAALVFGDSPTRPLRTNERSDLWHLATAIHQRVTGFVTSDADLLSAGGQIVQRFGVQILSPEIFQHGTSEVLEGRDVETALDIRLTMRSAATADDDAIRDLLIRYGLNSAAIAGHWIPFSGSVLNIPRVAVWANRTCIGYMVCAKVGFHSDQTLVRAIVDDAHPESTNAARLLFRALADALTAGPAQHLCLEVPGRQATLRDEARRFGFSAITDSTALVKIAAGFVLTRANWRQGRDALAKATQLRLPDSPPAFRNPSQLIELLAPDGNRRQLALDALETYLSPVLLCLPRRPAVITPIEPRFAGPLLGHSRQASFLPSGTATLYGERVYVGGPQTHRYLTPGTLMLFYESGGSGAQAIVAVARVTQAFLQQADALSEGYLQRSALTAGSIDQIGSSPVKAVSMIDNIFPLPAPVGLARLRELECGGATQLITTRPITDRQLDCILSEGFKP